MSISKKILWKRMVNQVRYIYNEKDLVKEIITENAPLFHEHYLRVAAQSGLDVAELNKTNEVRLDKIYTPKPLEISADNFSDFETVEEWALVPFVHPATGEPEDIEYSTTQDDKEIHESFRKLFKKLALKLHPDKITGSVTVEQGMENLRLFQEAKEALEKKKYFMLIDLADRYRITQPRNYEQQTRWMKKECVLLQNETNEQKATYNYIFSECENEEQKDNLVKQFIAHLFNIRLQ
jgi:hypothetical protein